LTLPPPLNLFPFPLLLPRKGGGEKIFLPENPMPKKDPMDRTSGFLKKNLETMPYKKRLEYLNQKLRGIT